MKTYILQDGKAYSPWVAYGRSEGANILFTVALAKPFIGFGCAAFSVNPGCKTLISTFLQL